MEILHKSLIVINRDLMETEVRDIPEQFDEFINRLILHVNINKNVKDYKSTSLSTEVIHSALTISNQPDDEEYVLTVMNVIANRLLSKELNAEQRVSNLNSNVQRGSLIQSLLYDENSEKYSYLLAKIEHSTFVDDQDFISKTGFPEDDNKIWKTCLLDLSPQDDVIFAKVYSNTGAKYWNNEFLELVELNNDEDNTNKAFISIDSVLKRKIKIESPHDYTIIRNDVISYFRSVDFFNYEDLIERVSTYIPESMNIEEYNKTIELLKDLPDKKKFDSQFNSVPAAIRAKIRTSYVVNTGINLKIDSEIDNLEENIYTYREDTGEHFIVIKTNNDDLYKAYLKTPHN